MTREYGDTFGRRLWRWLERFGFSDNPFALYEADQERSVLLPYFFDVPISTISSVIQLVQPPLVVVARASATRRDGGL